MEKFTSEQFAYELSDVISKIHNTTATPIESYLYLRVLVRLLTKLAALDIEQHEILPAYYGVLLALRDRQYCSPTELKVLLLVSRSNITSLLDRMERDNLIRRERDPEDRRGLRIFLTERGKSVCEKVIDPHLNWVNRTMAPLSPEDLEALNRILAKLWRELIHQATEADIVLMNDLKTALGG